jgi:hypothetical protein
MLVGVTNSIVKLLGRNWSDGHDGVAFTNLRNTFVKWLWSAKSADQPNILGTG